MIIIEEFIWSVKSSPQEQSCAAGYHYRDVETFMGNKSREKMGVP